MKKKSKREPVVCSDRYGHNWALVVRVANACNRKYVNKCYEVLGQQGQEWYKLNVDGGIWFRKSQIKLNYEVKQH